MVYVFEAPINPVVIVPTHRARFSEHEAYSMERLKRLLPNTKILLVIPASQHVGELCRVLPSAEPLHVPDECMRSVVAYNRLMISPRIWDLLGSYSHALIHEPDAILLRGDLREWCMQRWSYVGAPWFQHYTNADSNSPPIGVGNFGLSLHNLRDVRRVLHSNKRWYGPYQIVADLAKTLTRRRNRMSAMRAALKQGQESAGRMRGASMVFDGYCDTFWCRMAAKVDPDYLVAPIETALKFAWEATPRRCFELNRGRLPFGLHAWQRYDHAFALSLIQMADALRAEDPPKQTLHDSAADKQFMDDD